MVGDTPALLAEQLDKVLVGEVKLAPIYLPEDLAAAPEEAPAPELAIAKGFEVVRPQEAMLENGGIVTWQERLLIVRSKALAAVKIQALETRLVKAEAALLALTPAPGRGKRQFSDPVALQQAITTILTRYDVVDFLAVETERQVTMRHVRGYKGRPARTEE